MSQTWSCTTNIWIRKNFVSALITAPSGKYTDHTLFPSKSYPVGTTKWVKRAP